MIIINGDGGIGKDFQTTATTTIESFLLLP